jgi:hypothetical protein
VSIGTAGFLVSGLPVTVTVRSSSRDVALSAAGVPVTAVPLPDSSLLPCVPSAAFAHQVLTLSCRFTRVPSAFTSLA